MTGNAASQRSECCGSFTGTSETPLSTQVPSEGARKELGRLCFAIRFDGSTNGQDSRKCVRATSDRLKLDRASVPGLAYRIEITDPALADAEDHLNFIRDVNKDPDAAEKPIFAFEEMPERHPLIPEHESFTFEIRHSIYLSHRIIYRSEPDVRRVVILRVFHGSRRAFANPDLALGPRTGFFTLQAFRQFSETFLRKKSRLPDTYCVKASCGACRFKKRNAIRRFKFMKISQNLALAAAFAGLVGGTAARASQNPVGTQHSLAGTLSAEAAKKDIEKHACKGMNSCKGNGGGAKKEFGKNECKGKGACATDGSKPKM